MTEVNILKMTLFTVDINTTSAIRNEEACGSSAPQAGVDQVRSVRPALKLYCFLGLHVHPLQV